MRMAFVYSLIFHALFCAWMINKEIQLDSNAKEISSPSLQARTLSSKEFENEHNQDPFQKNIRRQVVQSDDKLKSLKVPDIKSETYLARHHQRFDQNTRAARIGEFKNVLKEGATDVSKLFQINESEKQNAPPSPSKSNPQRIPSNHSSFLKDGGTLVFKKVRSPSSESANTSKKGEGYSATDDYLPHIAIGANTLLNTREYKYASFYERIREKLNHQWKRLVRSEMDQLYLQGVHNIEGERITKLRIHLSENGKVVKIEKYGSAGYRELDRAAVQAFEVAGPFANPPQDLLEGPQNLVSIDWHFVIVGGSSTGIQMRVNRHPATY